MKINCTHTDMVGVHKITPNPKNNNRHSIEQIGRLAKIIDFQGQRRPLIISKTSGFLNCGHCTLEAIKSLGWKECAVDYQEFESEAAEYANMTADNELARWAELDKHIMLKEIEDGNLDIDLELLGIENLDLPEIELVPQADEDSVPELQPDPITKRGDVWLLGKHRVMCGDSTMIDDVEKLMRGEKADMVFTDPPYGINLDTDYASSDKVKGNTYRKIIDDDKEYSAGFLCEYFGSVEQFWWGANYYQDTLPKGGSWVVWDKSNEAQDRAIGSDFEICYSTKKHKNTFYRKLWKGFTAKEKGEKRVHPTQKPVEMVEWFFEKWGKGKSLMADLFLGSGPTLIACEKTNRKCYGMELDEKYCDVIIKRWQEYTGKEATLESTGETYNSMVK